MAAAMPLRLIMISYWPTVPLISTLNTDSEVGEETDMVRSTVSFRRPIVARGIRARHCIPP